MAHPVVQPDTALDEITGVGVLTAQVIIAELGLNMGQFPTAAHASAWAKLSPQTIQSGAKTRPGKTGKGNRWLRGALGDAAMAAGKTDTYLGERYRRSAAAAASKKPSSPPPAPASKSPTCSSPTPPSNSTTWAPAPTTGSTPTARPATRSVTSNGHAIDGYAKDPAHQALAQPARRRVRGIAAQSLFTALLLTAPNIRKIRAWRALTTDSKAHIARRARRRRDSLRDHLPDG